MKAKYIFLYAAVAVAFAAVSLWVIFSGGKSAKAIRTKFRLGGIMLTLAGMMSNTGCSVSCYEPVDPTCYDPAVLDMVSIVPVHDSGEVLHVGDMLCVTVEFPSCSRYSYKISTVEELPSDIQEGLLELDENCQAVIAIAETQYRGGIRIGIYTNPDGAEPAMVWASEFTLR